QGRCILAHDPLHTESADLFFQSKNRKLELSLLQRDGDKLVRKRSALPVRDERVQKRQAVFSSGNSHSDAIAWAQHRESPHRAADRIQYFRFNAHMPLKLYFGKSAPRTAVPNPE